MNTDKIYAEQLAAVRSGVCGLPDRRAHLKGFCKMVSRSDRKE